MKALAIRKKSTGEIVLGDYYYNIFPDNHRIFHTDINPKHYEIIKVEITSTNAPPTEPKAEGSQGSGCEKHNRDYSVGGDGETKFFFCPDCDKERTTAR